MLIQSPTLEDPLDLADQAIETSRKLRSELEPELRQISEELNHYPGRGQGPPRAAPGPEKP